MILGERIRRYLSFSTFSLLSFLVISFLTGCSTVGPVYEKPKVTLPSSWQKEILQQDPTLRPEPAKIKQWWTLFNDPILDQLISEAGTNNYDIRIAIARVEEAWAQVGVVFGRNLPQVNLPAYYSRERSSKNSLLPGGKTYSVYSAQVNASWEIDLFGQIKRTIEEAQANFEATQESRTDVMISVYAQVPGNISGLGPHRPGSRLLYITLNRNGK